MSTSQRTTAALSVAGLTFRVGAKTLVDHATFTVPAGRVIALVGPNGAGKSTLLRLIGGALPAADPTVAEVTLGDRRLLALPRRERARAVALLEQHATTEFTVTVEQVVGLGRIPFGRWWSADADADRIVAQAMARTGVAQWADRPLGTLSGGEQQRVQLARALAQQPRLLLLDEPTNHLDIAAQLDLFALLRELAEVEGISVVVALHDISAAAAHCDEAVVMDRGRIVMVGEVEASLDPELLQRVYGVRVDVLLHPRTGRPVITFSRADSPAG